MGEKANEKAIIDNQSQNTVFPKKNSLTAYQADFKTTKIYFFYSFIEYLKQLSTQIALFVLK